MTTLIAVYNSRGCVGRCDARCYNGAHARCTCICGGKNHGAGLDKAKENVALRADMTFHETSDEMLRFLQQGRDHLRMDWGALVTIDRLAIPNARQARREAYMKINQLRFPFFGGGDGDSERV